MAEQKVFDFLEQDVGQGLDSLRPAPTKHHPPTPRELCYVAPDERLVAQIAVQVGDLEGLHGATSKSSRKMVAAILAARGHVSGLEVEHLIRPDLSALPDIRSAKNFERGAETILAAIQRRDAIGVNGDFDADGITAVAGFVQMLRGVDQEPVWHIPSRKVDGYGLSDRLVQNFIDSKCKLVVLFDHGSHNISEIAKLRAAGIEVVVFDHHVVGETLPDAIVINPAQKGCGFQSYKPCASGLSYFLTRKLSSALGLPPPDPGLAAIGTIADVVPLVGPNRTIAYNGLRALRSGANRSIFHLAAQLGIDPASLSSVDVAFYIAPSLNAAGRLGDPRKCVELLLEKDEVRIRDIAAEIVSTNERRKEIQREHLLSNYDRLASLAKVPRVLVSNHPSHHQGVVGLTAQGLAQRYARPAFVLAPGGEGILKGSARVGSEHYDLEAILTEAKKSDERGVILKAGGHRAAAGVTIRAEGVNEFVKLISKAASRQMEAPPKSVAVVADARLTFKEVTPKLVHDIKSLLDPVGQGFQQPRYLFKSALVIDVTTFQGERRMFQLEQEGRRIKAFVGPELWDGSIEPGCVIDIIAMPTTIYRNDKEHVQLSIEAFKVIIPAVTSGDGDALRPSSLAPPEGSHEPGLQALKPPSILRPRPERVQGDRGSEGRARYLQLRDAAIASMNGLPREFIDADLRDLVDDPFGPDITPQLEATRIALIGTYGLTALRPDSFSVRPEQIEFIRWFLDRTDNAILQAPTGSGKTEMALVIASKWRSMGHRTVFCAPTIEIQRQVKDRAPQMIDVEAIVLDGETPPDKREKIYTEQDPAFISAIPHAIKNDIERGAFLFRPSDLLIIDEGHHTKGEYPYVPLVKKAREAGARVLLLSATPGQIEPEKSWSKFEVLKDLVGVEHIFPINVVRRQPTVQPQHLELPDDIRSSIADLSGRLEHLRNQVIEYLQAHGKPSLIREALDILGGSELKFPSANTLLPLIGKVRVMNEDKDRWQVVNALCGVIELSELYQYLAYQGVAGFLTRIVEKRLEIAFPIGIVRPSTGKTFLAAKRSDQLVYGSFDVKRAYDRLAQGPFVGLWDPRSLEKVCGLELATWRDKTTKDRRSLFNKHVLDTLKKLNAEIVTLPYSDHPKEQFIISTLRQMSPSEQSIVFVRDRAHALFLAARLSHFLGGDGASAVALTGSGHGMRRGLTRDQRRDNLESLAAGKARVIVSTSAGNEGIDFARVQRGFGYRFSASPTEALQQWGRLGRRDVSGSMTYLCAAPEEHGKFLSILRKVGDFFRMLNQERGAILERYGSRRR